MGKSNETRKLSSYFMNDLNDADGILNPILKRVRQDNTLMLAIRGNYINIYYRGGNILKIKEQSKNSYSSFFDNKYNKSVETITVPKKTIKSQNDAKEWVDAFPYLKEIMDLYFSNNNKPEREFQQLVARENNCSTISNESEYFISDIEFADAGLSARFDILAIRWLASHRKNGGNCRAALIEMKYGDGALGGSSGLLKHLQDINSLITDHDKYKFLLKTMESQFNQLDDLGMLSFKHCTNGTKVKLVANDPPEVIFILANHNPRSSKLKSILNTPEMNEYEHSTHFDLRFYVSSYAGYGLHSYCMRNLTQFRELLEK